MKRLAKVLGRLFETFLREKAKPDVQERLVETTFGAGLGRLSVDDLGLALVLLIGKDDPEIDITRGLSWLSRDRLMVPLGRSLEFAARTVEVTDVDRRKTPFVSRAALEGLGQGVFGLVEAIELDQGITQPHPNGPMSGIVGEIATREENGHGR